MISYHFAKVHRTAAKKCELTVGHFSPSISAFSHTARETNCNSQGPSRKWNLLDFLGKNSPRFKCQLESFHAMGQTR